MNSALDTRVDELFLLKNSRAGARRGFLISIVPVVSMGLFFALLFLKSINLLSPHLEFLTSVFSGIFFVYAFFYAPFHLSRGLGFEPSKDNKLFQSRGYFVWGGAILIFMLTNLPSNLKISNLLYTVSVYLTTLVTIIVWGYKWKMAKIASQNFVEIKKKWNEVVAEIRDVPFRLGECRDVNGLNTNKLWFTFAGNQHYFVHFDEEMTAIPNGNLSSFDPTANVAKQHKYVYILCLPKVQLEHKIVPYKGM